MGGCQSSDGIQVPKQATLGPENKFTKLQKHKFAIPENLKAKLELLSTNGKITDYITQNNTKIQLAYQQLDIGSSLGDDNKFEDKKFPTLNESLGDKPIAEHIEWGRPGAFMKGPFAIFEGKIEPNDIKQGKLGDCYLLSAMAAISQYPFIIKRIFETTEESSYGAYGVWLFIDGIWECVILDDQFPLHNNKPIYSRNNENQLWVMLIQKAYAKAFGSYEKIQSGLTGIAMSSLTGAPYEYLCKDSSNKVDIAAAWEFITSNIAQNHLLTGSTENNDRNKHMGLVSTHAYTILDCQQVHISTKKGKKKQRIIKLNNPWGRYEWKGRWSQTSDIWTQELKEQLNYEKADDGLFWINIEDFVQNFGQMCVCKYNKNYVNTSLRLEFNEHENDYKGIFIGINNRVEGYLNLIQKDHRFYPKQTYEYSLVRLIVLQIDKASRTLSKYINDVIDCDHDASIYLELDPGDYYVIVEVDWKCQLHKEMVLNFYGQQPISMIEDPHQLDIQHLFNEVVLLHQKFTEEERIYQYQKDPQIRRVTGSIAGYVYYHYSNKSKSNNYICEAVTLKEKNNISVHGQENKDDFIVKVYPGQERIVRLKVQKQGDSYYSFSTKIQFYIVEKYSLEKLRELADKKPTKVRKREIQKKQIDVVVKTYNYSGGIVLLYQNKMDKYAYVEEITFDIDNLELENDELGRSRKFEVQLQPQGEKMLSFLVSSPGKQVVFRTKVSFYLNSPEFKF